MNQTTGSQADKRFTILAVDDERANLNLLRRTFHGEYNLHLAEDGFTGIDLLKEHPVDMIITDQRMPRMTGVQMLTKSREIIPDAVRIVLTAYTDVEDIIEAVNQGEIYRYVLKPWSPSELKITVANALQHYSLQKENRDLVVKLQASLEELKAAQEELISAERLSTLGRMASTIIHDLKLPMTNIRSSAALLARDNIAQEMRSEFSRIITREVDRLIDMTREILDFSRGELRLNILEFDIGDLLGEIVALIERDFNERHITIERSWEKELGKIHGDRERLRRVLLNLVTNARDAMLDGDGILHIAADSLNGRICIRVMDNGHGIQAEIIDQIFTPFITHGKHNGTGLGMTIAKNIVEAHQGSIKAYNRDEGGACIEMELPISK